jgi:hypothetical protein
MLNFPVAFIDFGLQERFAVYFTAQLSASLQVSISF